MTKVVGNIGYHHFFFGQFFFADARLYRPGFRSKPKLDIGKCLALVYFNVHPCFVQVFVVNLSSGWVSAGHY